MFEQKRSRINYPMDEYIDASKKIRNKSWHTNKAVVGTLGNLKYGARKVLRKLLPF